MQKVITVILSAASGTTEHSAINSYLDEGYITKEVVQTAVSGSGFGYVAITFLLTKAEGHTTNSGVQSLVE